MPFDVVKYKDSPKFCADIACPACGFMVDWQTLSVINVSAHPELRQYLTDYSLFTAVCPKCKQAFAYFHEFLYVDDKQRIAIFVCNADTDTSKSVTKMFDSLNEYRRRHYKTRIVKNINRFFEKLNLFECGLDDRAVEFTKSKIIDDAVAKADLTKLSQAESYFHINDDGSFYIMCYADGRHLCKILIADDMYYMFADVVREKLGNTDVDSKFIVDNSWHISSEQS